MQSDEVFRECYLALLSDLKQHFHGMIFKTN